MTFFGIPLCAGESIEPSSFVLTKRDGNIYEFKGLSTDEGKLPVVKAIGTGSTALLIDTGVIKMYEATSKTWYDL